MDSRKEFVTLKKASMVTDVPEIRLLYAAYDGLCHYVKMGSLIFIHPPEIIELRRNQLMNSLTRMIKHTLIVQNRYDESWVRKWEEEDEEPMTMADYERWIKDKVDKLGCDMSMGAEERIYWRQKGLCV